MDEQPKEVSIFCQSGLSRELGPVVSVQVNGKELCVLTAKQGIMHGIDIIQATLDAENDELIFNFLREKCLFTRQAAAERVIQFRDQRKVKRGNKYDDMALRAVGVLGIKHGPCVQITWMGKIILQMRLDEAKHHAECVLQVAEAANTDEIMAIIARGTLGLTTDQMTNMYSQMDKLRKAQSRGREGIV